MSKRRLNRSKAARAEAERRIQTAIEKHQWYLDLDLLGLTELPKSVEQLTHLQWLNVGRNHLTELPESVGRLAQLQILWLGFNHLRELPTFVGQLNRLRELGVTFNQLMLLPTSLGQLTQLRSLDLAGNQLTELPESLGQLTQLQSLNLGHNPMKEFPTFLGRLTRLKSLVLSGNGLTGVPEFLGQLTRLESLDVSNNQLTELPASLRDRTGLNELFLHGNDALGLPTEVLGATRHDVLLKKAATAANPADILDYYFRLRAGKRPLNEAKLILLGRGGVGKTSLVNRLLWDRFNRDEMETEGICISGWRLCLRRSEDVRLNVWDFGGQEIMHTTHQFFLSQRTLYLLVLDGRQGAENADAEYWLRLIESFGTENSGDVSPVLVVLNKIKLHPFDLNRRALRQKYPFIRGFFTTDCEDRTGITELRTAIERETDQLKHLRDGFPAAWFAIKDRLAAMKENYVTFERYRQLCATLGERDPVAQDSLAFYLHSLGIALTYKDDPRLRDTHVLNPHWVTDGIYKILNAPRLGKQKGELHLGEVADILDPVEYPRHMHRFLFDLMKKFDLCFRFPDNDAHYLIPELLDKEEAVEAVEFRPEECLNFRPLDIAL